MITPAQVTAVIVTRGNVDLKPIIDVLPFGDVLIWDNSKEETNWLVFGRYVAALASIRPVIYTLDDDAIPADAASILEHYEPGVVTCNMTEGHMKVYPDWGLGLVGFGAIFDRELIVPTFQRYSVQFAEDEIFLRECDRVFTGLNKLKYVQLPFQHREHASAPEQMWKEKRHGADLKEIRRRIEVIRNAAA